MTEPDDRLTRGLRARAEQVLATPDLLEVERRSDDRQRRRARGVGVALALIAVLGSVGGYALGSTAAATVGAPNLLAAGAASGDSTGDDGSPEGEAAIDLPRQLSGVDAIEPLPLISDRTTDQGIRLVTSSAPAGDLSGPQSLPADCDYGAEVRVGVLRGATQVGVVARSISPAHAEYAGGIAITGFAEGQPIWVVMVQTSATEVTATFPDGSVDHVAPTNGIAVLAALADPGRPAAGYLLDTVQVDTLEDGERTVRFGDDPCRPIEEPSTTTTAVDPIDKPPLPEPGEPPADAVTAEDQVRAAYLGAFDSTSSQDEKSQFIERSAVWRDANQQFLEGPYGTTARDLQAVVDEVVFTDPTHASVRFQLIATDDRVPRYQIGDAVLVEGRWLVAISTPCELLELAQVHCNMDL